MLFLFLYRRRDFLPQNIYREISFLYLLYIYIFVQVPLHNLMRHYVFLHYNDLKTKGALENKYDGRPHLGLPSAFKQKNV